MLSLCTGVQVCFQTCVLIALGTVATFAQTSEDLRKHHCTVSGSMAAGTRILAGPPACIHTDAPPAPQAEAQVDHDYQA